MGNIATSFLTWKRYLQRRLLPYEITLKQTRLLAVLAKKPHLFPAEVAEMLFCDRPTATVVLKNMERRGWLQRERDPDDGKRVRVKISKAGRKKLTSLPRSDRSGAGSTFDPLGCFRASEITQFARLLGKLNKHLQVLRGPTD